ncbi:MAG TPA: hypothetical protein VGE29_03610 [Prosthecobacter sp.]
MDVLLRHARVLYLFALLQLLGGPLVLGGMMLVSKVTADAGVKHPVTLVSGEARASEACFANASDEWTWSAEHGLLPPKCPKLPESGKTKEGKGKLWAFEDLAGAGWRYPGPSLTGMHPFRDRVPWRLAHEPPAPPPRWS